MTEESYQAGRKVMQRANYLRGIITTRKGAVAKWGNIEDSHRRNLLEDQANAAKKMLDKAMVALDKSRKEFASIIFPPNDMITPAKEYAQCEGCCAIVSKEQVYCSECLK